MPYVRSFKLIFHGYQYKSSGYLVDQWLRVLILSSWLLDLDYSCTLH